jgi:acetylornithine aminotransferase
LARVNGLLDRLRTYPVESLLLRKASILERGIPLFDFGVGDPLEPTPPFILDAVRRGIGETSQYPAIEGTRALRLSIQAYLRRRFGVDLDPERNILATSGSKEAIFHLPLAVVDRDAEDRAVVFPDPSYPAYERGALFAGGEPVPVPLSGDWSFRPWELPRELLKRARILYLNVPHNPTGCCMGLEDLRRTRDLCLEHDILLVSDECYADLYDREAPPSILQTGVEGVLAVHSLSKRSGMTGFRTGFLAGDPAWIELLRGFRMNPGLASQDFVDAAATAAWSDDAHAARRRELFSARRRIMMDFLGDAGLHPVRSGATFYLWFSAPEGYDDITYAERLLDAGIVVSPGRFFSTTSAGEGYLRLALVPPQEQCLRAIEAWMTLL